MKIHKDEKNNEPSHTNDSISIIEGINNNILLIYDSKREYENEVNEIEKDIKKLKLGIEDKKSEKKRYIRQSTNQYNYFWLLIVFIFLIPALFIIILASDYKIDTDNFDEAEFKGTYSNIATYEFRNTFWKATRQVAINVVDGVWYVNSNAHDFTMRSTTFSATLLFIAFIATWTLNFRGLYKVSQKRSQMMSILNSETSSHVNDGNHPRLSSINKEIDILNNTLSEQNSHKRDIQNRIDRKNKEIHNEIEKNRISLTSNLNIIIEYDNITNINNTLDVLLNIDLKNADFSEIKAKINEINNYFKMNIPYICNSSDYTINYGVVDDIKHMSLNSSKTPFNKGLIFNLWATAMQDPFDIYAYKAIMRTCIRLMPHDIVIDVMATLNYINKKHGLAYAKLLYPNYNEHIESLKDNSDISRNSCLKSINQWILTNVGEHIV